MSVKKKSLVGYVVKNWSFWWIKEPNIKDKWLGTSTIWNNPMPFSKTKVRITIRVQD